MYEITNEHDHVFISCVASTVGLDARESERMQALGIACGALQQDEQYLLAQWEISTESGKSLTDELEQLYDYELAWFETELSAWGQDSTHKSRAFPRMQLLPVSKEDFRMKCLWKVRRKASC